MILAMTQGTSVIQAKPIFSCIRENPGPLVAVIAFTPARDAPIMAPMLAISSSI
jgi:predicted secreted protein